MELAQAYVQIIPSAKGIKGSISESMGGEASSAGDSAGTTLGKNLVSKLKGIIAAAGLGVALKKSLMEGADLQQSIGGVETLFKDSADTVIANAKAAYETAGMSANEYMETVTSFSASLLQGLGGDTAAAASIADMALIDMADNANKMGTSMESIQNAYQGFAKQNYTMLDNLKLGYGGTKTEMERLLAEAKKLSGVDYNIDNLADVYNAIHVIQEEMGITGTTAKEASATFSGSVSAMKAAANNLLGSLTLGEDIGPALKSLGDTVFTFLVGNLFPMVGNVLSNLPEVLESAISMAIRGLNIVSNNAEQIIQMGLDLVTGIAEAIVAGIPYILEAGWNLLEEIARVIVTTDWKSVLEEMIFNIKNSLDLAAGEILGADGSIIDAVCETIRVKLPEVIEKGREMVGSFVSGLMEKIPEVVIFAGDLLAGFLEKIGEELPKILESGREMVGSFVSGLMEKLPDMAISAGELLGGFLAKIGEELPEVLKSGLELVGELIAGIIDAIPDIISTASDVITNFIKGFGEYDWTSIGSDIIEGIKTGLTNGLGAIGEAAKNVAKSALSSAKSFLGIASPSKVMRDQVGKWIPAGMAVGIEENIDDVSTSMKKVSAETVSAVNVDFTNKIKTPLETFPRGTNTMENLLELLVTYLPAIANMKIILDSGATIGELAPGMNTELGRIQNRADRGR